MVPGHKTQDTRLENTSLDAEKVPNPQPSTLNFYPLSARPHLLLHFPHFPTLPPVQEPSPVEYNRTLHCTLLFVASRHPCKTLLLLHIGVPVPVQRRARAVNNMTYAGDCIPSKGPHDSPEYCRNVTRPFVLCPIISDVA